MTTPFHTKFSILKWSLSVLLVLFIFSPGISSSSPQQKEPAQTEQRDEARPVKTLFQLAKSHQPVAQNSFLSEIRFFPSLIYYSNSIEVSFKNRADLVLLLSPIGMNLIANFLPRSEADNLFQIRDSSYL